MQFAAPKVRGLPRVAAALELEVSRVRVAPAAERSAALRNDTDPPPVVPTIPRFAGLHQEAAPRWAGDHGESASRGRGPGRARGRARSVRGSVRAVCSVFPDRFYVSERGRFFPDDSQDKGRLLSAGYHNVMGFFRDDVPLA